MAGFLLCILFQYSKFDLHRNMGRDFDEKGREAQVDEIFCSNFSRKNLENENKSVYFAESVFYGYLFSSFKKNGGKYRLSGRGGGNWFFTV